MNTTIVITAMIIAFFQVIHIFEEIALKAYSIINGKNQLGRYLQIASLLVFINFIIIILFVLKQQIAYYLAFIMVILSVGNTFAHFIFLIRGKGRLGYGFPSSIPLGVVGFYLLYQLITYLFL